MTDEFRYKKGDANWDIEPVDKNRLIRILEKCNNTLWDGGKMNPIDAFDELSKIIFVKIRDEQIPRKAGAAYDFQIKTHETPISVHARITSLYDDAKDIDPEVFSENVRSSPEKLLTVVNHLQDINLSKTDLDTKGVAFERFMEDFFKGKQGQYFTPREIVNFIVELVDLTNEQKVLDPACGSSGFLLHALDFIRSQAADYYPLGSVENFKYWHGFAKDNLYGIEVNERIARVAKMNMIIHDDGHTNVICSDALEDIDKINGINQRFNENTFDVVLTNPPFGANVESNEKPYLKNFYFGKTSQGKTRKSQKTEILFIERCWNFLKPGGILAIILPDGILTNITQKYVRDYLLDKFELQAIFSLPQITFLHYGAGLKSSVLLLRKRKAKEEITDNDVFCAIIDKVGYDGTGRDDHSDLPDVVDKFRKFKSGIRFSTKNVYVKKVSQFNKNRLDPYYYSPFFDEIIGNLKKSKYPLKPLSKICDDVFSGKTPAKADYSENQANPKIVKVASLKTERVDFSFVSYVKDDAVSEKYVVDGDILILSAAHQAEYLGKNPCIVNMPKELDNENIMFVAELINVRANKIKINPLYLLQLFTTNKYFLLINREKRGQTAHLYPRDLKTLLIPVPPMNEQNQSAESYKKNLLKYEELVAKANGLLDATHNEFEENFL